MNYCLDRNLPDILIEISPDLSGEALASIYITQGSKNWRTWLWEKVITKAPREVFDCIYARLAGEKKISKSQAVHMSEFIEKYTDVLPSDDVKKMMTLFEQKKCPVTADLQKLPAIARHLDGGGQIPIEKEHPIEEFVREKTKKTSPDPRIIAALKKGIHYVEPRVMCSCNVLAFVIARYAEKMSFDKNGRPDLTRGDWLSFDQEADFVAAALDRKELSEMLTRLVKGSYGLYLLSWARYALDDRISELMAGHISMSRGKAKLDGKGANFYEALMLSDTQEAMQMFNKYVHPDFMTFAEDMSYNNGPMLSEEMFDEFLLPYYRRTIPKLKALGTRVLIDSDGDITKALPWFERAGIEGILPLERQAGVDLLELRKDHPKCLFLGHYDKMVMPKGEEAMRQEFERLLPVMRQGGFIPSVDHQTPPGVSLENYRIYLRLLKEYAEKI